MIPIWVLMLWIHIPQLCVYSRSPSPSPSPSYRPVVLIHGLNDNADHLAPLSHDLHRLYPGIYTYAPAIAENLFSIFTDINDQLSDYASAIRSDYRLSNGFNLIGFSQGALIARAYVQRYNRPRVHRLISIVGPQEGIDGCPKLISPLICSLFQLNPYHRSISFGGYWKDVRNRNEYLNRSTFLADINNERSVKNEKYRENMESLDLYALVHALNDTVIQPNISEDHRFWEWGQPGRVQTMEQTPGYRHNWIGLRRLDREGKLIHIPYRGDHIDISGVWNRSILPLLNDTI